MSNRNVPGLPEFIKQLRTKSGFSQQAVAGMLTVDRATYSNYELGKHVPDCFIIYRLSRIYNIEPNAFFQISPQSGANDEPLANFSFIHDLTHDEVMGIMERRLIEDSPKPKEPTRHQIQQQSVQRNLVLKVAENQRLIEPYPFNRIFGTRLKAMDTLWQHSDLTMKGLHSLLPYTRQTVRQICDSLQAQNFISFETSLTIKVKVTPIIYYASWIHSLLPTDKQARFEIIAAAKKSNKATPELTQLTNNAISVMRTLLKFSLSPLDIAKECRLMPSQVYTILSQLRRFELVEKIPLKNGRLSNVYKPTINETDFMSQTISSILTLIP